MRIPTLSVIIASQAVIWCIAGAAIHGPMILLYPASWLAIGAAFYFHNKKYPIKLPAVSVPTDEKWANSHKPTGESKSQQDDLDMPHSISATE